MSAASRSERTATVPTDGHVVTLRIDGRTPVVWWGTGSAEDDLLATRGRRLWVWSSPEACIRVARECGWDLALDADSGQPEVSEIDVEVVQGWLRGPLTTLDPEAGLALWNMATDVAHSLGSSFHDRGRLANRCYDKLFAASMPGAFGVESYVPRWTPAEVRVLRRVLGEAVHLIRSGVADRGTDG